MEHTAAWGASFEFQLAATNWTAEEEPAGDAQAWAAPAAGHPLEYASIVDIFGSSCSLQPYVAPASSSSSSGGQQQLVEYNYYNYDAAAAQHHDPDPMEAYMNSPEKLFQERTEEFKQDAKLMKMKMHRYPPGIEDFGEWLTEPNVVAIGPYHRCHRYQKAEKMKHVAARYCIEKYKEVNKNSGLSVQHMYDAVVSVTEKINARGLYDDKEVMAGMGYEDEFLPMMFYDACFLVMYMLWRSYMPGDRDLNNFFESNDNYIARDIMLLENQIPLKVVDAVMNMCTLDPLQKMWRFIVTWREEGFMQARADNELHPVNWDQVYNEAPHLLGLLRFYDVGRRSREEKKLSKEQLLVKYLESKLISVGAIELAEMGIFLAANKTTELTDMDVANKWIILGELSMAPLCLNKTRASWLVNMAALELCTTPDFLADEAEYEDSAVCSYLLLLCMLMHRLEDVHDLRTRGILKGAGLTNKETLEFFSSLQNLRKGRGYVIVMYQIQNYKNTKPIKVYAFLYNNWKYIVGVASAFAGFIGILTALLRLKGAH